MEDKDITEKRRKEWRQRVREIKDMVHVQTAKGGGKRKRQRGKASKKKNTNGKKNKNRGGAVATVQPRHGSEASEEPSEEESEEKTR